MHGQNNEDIFYMNRSLVIQYLQKNKVTTRAQLSKALKLTPASITKIVNELIEKKLIEETGFISGDMGRRSVGIKLKQNFRIIGVKLSRRNFSIGVFGFNAEVFETYRESFHDESLDIILDKIKEQLESLLRKYTNSVAIGMAVPGPYLEHESRIVLVTETKGWDKINLREAFADQFDVPVIIRHDANSGALSEWWFGDYDNNGTLIHFLVGEGVGAGIIDKGRILTGTNGIAGEIGHVSINIDGPRCGCGNYGCLEQYCSSLSFIKQAAIELPKYPESRLNGYENLKARHIFDAAYKGDDLACRLVKKAGRYIGYGVVTLINCYDPSTIVISNDMARGGEMLLEEVVKVVAERVSNYFAERVKICLSKFTEDPILYGAAAVAMDYCLRHPLILGEQASK